MGLEVWSGVALWAFQKPREFVGEVSSFADLLFAKADFRVWTWTTPCFDTRAVESGMCLVLGQPSRTGCGGGRPRIAHSQKLALESTTASRLANDTALSIVAGQHDHYLVQPSGMRRQTASHCAFAKMGPQTGECAPGPSIVGEVPFSTVNVYVYLMFVNASTTKMWQ